METEKSIARAWLGEMQTCVRAVDFERCRAIFAQDVVGFGTKAAIAVGLVALERDQWRHIWGNIRNFTFQAEELYCKRYGDGLWLACPWNSEGRMPNGTWECRPGRITAVLERRGDLWLAVHTHHSRLPDSSLAT